MERGFVQTFIDYMSLLIPAKGEAYLMLASGAVGSALAWALGGIDTAVAVAVDVRRRGLRDGDHRCRKDRRVEQPCRLSRAFQKGFHFRRRDAFAWA